MCIHSKLTDVASVDAIAVVVADLIGIQYLVRRVIVITAVVAGVFLNY